MMKQCNRGRFTLAALCLSILSASCAYSDVRWYGSDEVEHSPRGVPAQRTSKSADALRAEGYFSIGTITIEKKKAATSVAAMGAWIRKESAKRGGDLIRITRDCEVDEKLSQSFYTPRRSTSWTSGGRRTTTTYFGPTQSTIESMDIYRSSGVVWRHDPARARERIAAKKKAAAEQRLLTELWRAVEARDVRRARKIVATRKVPNYFPRPVAEWKGDAKMATSLFSESLRLGCTELFVELVKARAPSGWGSGRTAHPFASDSDKKSVFRHIVEQDDVKALSALLDAGLNPAHFPAGFGVHTALVHGSDHVLGRLLSLDGAGNTRDWLRSVPLYPRWRKPHYVHGTPLHLAAELDKAEFIHSLVLSGVPVQTRVKHGKPEIVGLTALQLAAMRGRNATVAALLSVRANPRSETKDGKTAMDLARERGHEKTARLLALGTKPAAATTLAEAARDGDLSTVRRLLASEDVDHRDDRGRTALMYAAAAGDDVMLAALLAAKPDLGIRDEAGATSADVARDREIKMMLLARGCEISADDGDFLRAVQEDDLELMPLMIKSGVNVNAPGKDGNTALHLMAGRGNTEMVALLLEHGADPNPRNNNGSTPMQVSISRKIRKLLLDAGARVPATADALVRAAFQGEVETVRQILAAGVDADARRKNGDTALIMAVKMLKKEVLVLLLEKGADPNATDGKGRSPLDYAFLASYREILVAAGGRHTEAGRKEYERKLRR